MDIANYTMPTTVLIEDRWDFESESSMLEAQTSNIENILKTDRTLAGLDRVREIQSSRYGLLDRFLRVREENLESIAMLDREYDLIKAALQSQQDAKEAEWERLAAAALKLDNEAEKKEAMAEAVRSLIAANEHSLEILDLQMTILSRSREMTLSEQSGAVVDFKKRVDESYKRIQVAFKAASVSPD